MATFPSQHTSPPARPAATPAAQPVPALFFETVNSYQRTAALRAAIELDIFTAIAEQNDTVVAIARRCGCAERGMRILCDYLVISGLLGKEANRYQLTPESAMFLDRRSPAYLGGTLKFLLSPMLREAFERLAESARKGRSVLDEERGSLVPDNDVWVEFARAMAPMMVMPAELLARLLQADGGAPWKVLDIAAGHGMYGITLARHNPQARIVAVDWANVLEVAKENAHHLGVAERWQALPGSAFDVEYGSDYDVALLTNFCHHFDVPTNEQLLRKVQAALKPGGRAAIFDFVPNEDRVTPPRAGAFALTMLATTPSGDAYTFEEYRGMLGRAGFSTVSLHESAGPDNAVVMAVK